MHGLILTALRDFAASFPAEVGDVWAAEPEFLMTEAYPDEEFDRLVSKTARATGVVRSELLRGFGEFAGRETFARLYPEYYARTGNTLAFLLGVEERIHELVRATVPFAQPPRLHVRPLGASGVIVSYTSERKLCSMLEGLVIGVAGHYGERLELSHPQCMLRQDVGCAIIAERPAA